MRLRPLLLLPLLGISLNAMAEWTEARGEAKIINGNLTQAREAAMDNAINMALLSRGGSFQSTQSVSQGRLTQNDFSLSSQAQISSVELVSEMRQGDKLKVVMRLDILDGPDNKCQSSAIKAAILVPQASIKDRSQLRYGQLENFQRSLSERIAATLDKQSSTSFAHLHAKERLDIKEELINIRGYRLPTWISEITDSQYLLLPQIIDISTEPAESGFMGLWDSEPQRLFQLQLSLYHGISGEQIWYQNYSISAPWEFAKNESVAPNSDRFWRASYGQAIDKVLANASKDIDMALACRPRLAQIVVRQQDRVILNLGRRNGIRVGDQFQIVLQQNLPDRMNQMRAVAGETRAKITIDQVTEESAIAVLSGENAALNIQVNDIAIKI